MSRGKLAFLIGVIGFVAYIVAATALGDVVVQRHWALQVLYYIAAGVIWVVPAVWLMRWGAKR
ncbi:DUF2842 domain-containing protein [Roseococcus sp. YIM B11640]|uniref:DUF2842 domain-containing protein n=1 Tax=Roseococcus sp. YIM B11640 TaxID=3133973 RepID=UPI003C7C28A7